MARRLGRVSPKYEINPHNRGRDEVRREANQVKAREVLINTLAKIHALEPTMGGKWRTNMLRYYRERLAELVLYQIGFSIPSQEGIKAMAAQIADILDPCE